MNTFKKVCVHDGVFHLDEVTAVAMLKLIFDVELTRSREPAVWALNDLLVDVGGEFNAATGRFDHHQRGFQDTMRSLGKGPFDTKLSSAGLVYAHFGPQIIAACLTKLNSAGQNIAPQLSEQEVRKVFLRVYAKFIEPIDANDNGIARYDGQLPPPKFDNGYIGLPAMISLFNADDVIGCAQKNQFSEAVDFVGDFFEKIVYDVVTKWLPAETAVTKAATEAIAQKRPYMLMDEFYPVQEYVEAVPGNESLLYVITQDKGKNQFVVKCLNKKGDQFTSRKPLCEPWRGLNGTALDEAMQNVKCAQGIGHLPHPTGAVFVHAAGFIGAHATQEGAIYMALMSANA